MTTSSATGPGGAVHVFDLADGDGRSSGHIDQRAADQVADVDFVGFERGALLKRDGDDEASKRFGVGDGTGLGEVEDDAALVQPVGLEFDFARASKMISMDSL